MPYFQTTFLFYLNHPKEGYSIPISKHTVSPQYAVASSGYANAYKHPTIAVQNRVRAHGITLLRTDLSGALVFALGQDDIFQGRLKKDKFYWQKKPFE